MGMFCNFRKTARRTVAGGQHIPALAGSVGATPRLARLPAGRWTKWAVLAFWIAVVVVAGPLAGKLNDAQQNQASDFLPKNAESTRVVELAKRFVPSDTYPAVVVYEHPGPITGADQAKAAADARRFAGLDHVGGKVVGPIPASDSRALQVVVPIKAGEDGWNAIAPVVKDLRSITHAGGGRVYVTGPAGYAADFNHVFQGFDSTLLYVTALIVIVILLFTYRSPVLWILPLACVLVALTAAQAVIYLLARHAGLTVNGQSAFLLTVLVFGAGTDYALLLVARYREELRRHPDRHQAMAVALHRAGPAHPGFLGADRAGRVGADRAAYRPPAPAGVGGDGGRAGRDGAGPDRAEGQRAAEPGCLPHQARGGGRRTGAGPPLRGRRW